MINHSLDAIFPISNPVLKFALILIIILLAPSVSKKLKIPSIISLILAGALFGPNGLNLMQRDSSIILFGTVGLLYIMFIAGLEIDLADFKKNSHKSIVFGLYTFLIPMFLGILSAHYFLKINILSSILLASLFASHTLVTYPILGKYGITKDPAVNITVGGTMITDVLALLVLAVIVGITKNTSTLQFWFQFTINLMLFILTVIYLFPMISRYFLKNINDSISQYIFILAVVFLSSFLAELSGIEAIIGAFLAGLALNQLIPHSSPLMNRIDFIGNALFIPFFLIGVGMLINFKIIFTDLHTIKIAITMIIIATMSKYIAACLTQKTFKLNNSQRDLIFGLSNSQAAATLAAVLVAYNIVLGTDSNGAAIRLLDEKVLDATILMILATCTIASFYTQKGASKLSSDEISYDNSVNLAKDNRILIPLSYPKNIEELIHLALSMKSKYEKNSLFALNIILTYDQDEKNEKKSKEILEKAAKIVEATDDHLNQIMRYDINVSNAISNVILEHKISDLIIGLHHKQGFTDTYLGHLTESIIDSNDCNIYVYKSKQPINTLKRMVVVFPENAEKELGFNQVIYKICNLVSHNGIQMILYASDTIIKHINEIHKHISFELISYTFVDWDDFLIISSNVQDNDGLFILLGRSCTISYQNQMEKIPKYLNKYFANQNIVLCYPKQLELSRCKYK